MDSYANVNAIDKLVRHQLHHDQRFEGNHAEVGRIIDGLDLRGGKEIIWPFLFTAEQQFDGLAGTALRTVAEHNHIEQFTGDEAALLKGGSDVRQIATANNKLTSRVLRTAPSSTIATHEATAFPPTTA
jgi:hypothetical protein